MSSTRTCGPAWAKRRSAKSGPVISSGYQVTPQLMELADPKAVFMHDLPAHVGEEISQEMLTHRQSIVFDQAENRMHAQAALMATLLGAIPSDS